MSYKDIKPLNQSLKMKIVNTHTQVLLAISETSRKRFVPIENIVYCEAINNYSKIHLIDEIEIVISKTLKSLEALLTEFGFIRCHRSYLINMAHLEELSYGDCNQLKLAKKITIPLSRAGTKNINSFLNK